MFGGCDKVYTVGAANGCRVPAAGHCLRLYLFGRFTEVALPTNNNGLSDESPLLFVTGYLQRRSIRSVTMQTAVL